MKIILRVAAFLLVLSLVVSCGGRHCISVGGNYEGVDGSVEYCYDAGEAEKAGAPVFRDEKKTWFGIDENTLSDLVDKLKEEVGGLTMESTAVQEDEHPMRQLLRLLKEGEKNGN